MNINIFIKECLDLKNKIELQDNCIEIINKNIMINEYNKKINDMITKLQIDKKEDVIETINQNIPLSINTIEKDNIINKDEQVVQDKQNYNYEYEDYDDYDDDWIDDYDDFSMGKTNRNNKGTGNNNYREKYTNKHIRAFENRFSTGKIKTKK